MTRYRFYSNCPVCCDEQRFYWVHATDNGDDYIWDDCDLECDKCKNKSFILHHRFKCGMNNHNEYKEVDAYALIEAITSLATSDTHLFGLQVFTQPSSGVSGVTELPPL